MVRICIRKLRIAFEWLGFALEWFESLSKGLNLDSNALNPFRMFRICIRMLPISFEWFEFAFECSESLSNGSNLDSNGSNLDSYGSNLDSNGSNFRSNVSDPFQVLWVCIQMLRTSFKLLEFPFEWFKSLSKGLNLDSSASNPLKWFEFVFECFKWFLNG